MDAFGLLTLFLGLTGVICFGTWSIYRNRDRIHLSHIHALKDTPPPVPLVARGLESTAQSWGWTIHPTPQAQFAVSASFPTAGRLSTVEARFRYDPNRPDLTTTLAKLALSESLAETWRWEAQGWVTTLSPQDFHERFHDAEETAGFRWARGLMSQVRAIAACLETLDRLSPELRQLINAIPPGSRMTLGPEAFELLVEPLLEVGETEPAFVARVADHLNWPQLWVRLLSGHRIRFRALERLLTRWPATPHEEVAIEDALKDPIELVRPQLNALFGALQRREDPRLLPTLMALAADARLFEREEVLQWLNNCGDASVVQPLRALQGTWPAEWRDRLADTVRAIQFRLAEAYNRTLGGLSLPAEAGTLSFVEPSENAP